MIKKTILAAIFAASLAAVALPAAAVTYVRIAPPPPREEMVPAHRPGYVFAPGHWEWRNNHYRWAKGTWIHARNGYRYNPHAWVERDGRWYMERGHWQRGDRDRDGVPDRYDRAPKNPHRS